jgi:hypothetical protein
MRTRTGLLLLLLSPTLSAQAAWSLLYPPTSPPPRTGATMTCMGDDGSVLLFAGRLATILPLQPVDAWLLQGNTWTQLSGPLPPAREGAAMAFDVRRGQVVMFGGLAPGGGALGDTWTFRGNVWQQEAPGPAARCQHGMVYDPIRLTILMFGGGVPTSSQLNGTYHQDTWEWLGSSWNQVPSQANGPTARIHGLMAFDAVNGKVLLHGGARRSSFSGGQDVTYTDTWLFDANLLQWQQQFPSAVPPGRDGGAIAADLERGRVIVHGGLGANDYPWEWNGQTWSLRVESCPSARHSHTMVFDEPGHRLVMFGGENQGGATTDLWAFGSLSPTSTTRYGAGCAGPAGTPQLDHVLFSYPWLGETFESEVRRVPAGNTPVFFATGFAQSAFDLTPIGMPGCWQHVAPLLSDLRIASGGRATWSLVIPSHPAFVGLQLYQQALMLAPGANAAGVVASNGLDIRVGSR